MLEIHSHIDLRIPADLLFIPQGAAIADQSIALNLNGTRSTGVRGARVRLIVHFWSGAPVTYQVTKTSVSGVA
jgi:hypothetical protein